MDVEEEVVFLKIESRKTRKVTWADEMGGDGATGGNGDKEKRIKMKTPKN